VGEQGEQEKVIGVEKHQIVYKNVQFAIERGQGINIQKLDICWSRSKVDAQQIIDNITNTTIHQMTRNSMTKVFVL
jgi:hypothetical protein